LSRRVALPGVSSDYCFAAVEGLGMAGGRIAADAAQPHHGEEGFRGKPAVAALAWEMLEQAAHLLSGDVLAQRHEEVGVAEVAVIFRHLVLPDQVIAEGAVGELGRNAMVLMKIAAVMRQDERGIDGALQALERVLDLAVLGREKAVAEGEQLDRRSGGLGENALRARAGFLMAALVAAQHQPMDAGLAMLAEETADGAATADLDVIGM